MPIVLKKNDEIEAMYRAGVLVRRILGRMSEAALPGKTTAEVDDVARVELARAGARSLSRNYPTYREGHGFPGYTCVSVNEEVIHGIPGARKIADGDIVKIDLALELGGYCADAAVTVAVGNVAPQGRRLIDITREALELAVSNMRPGRQWSDIARMIQWHVESAGFSVVREYCGHGVGKSMHEDPKVSNFVSPREKKFDFRLEQGMTLAVEPMVIMGRKDIRQLEDGWTVVSADGSPAAHFEHTVAVVSGGARVLTPIEA